MRKIILSVSSAALMMLAAGAAQAADLPPPPAPAPAMFSFTAFGGASWLNDVDTSYDDFFNEDAEISFDTGYLIGGAAGFTLVDWARTELEVAYAGYDLDSIDLEFDGTYDDLDGSIGVLTVMGNVWFGFNNLPLVGGPVDQAGSGLGFSPYFGGGLGVGFVDVNGSTADSFDLDTSTGFAWQVGAGIRWNFVSNIGLDLGYRYRNVMDVGFGGNWDSADLSSNNVVLGVVFNF